MFLKKGMVWSYECSDRIIYIIVMKVLKLGGKVSKKMTFKVSHKGDCDLIRRMALTYRRNTKVNSIHTTGFSYIRNCYSCLCNSCLFMQRCTKYDSFVQVLDFNHYLHLIPNLIVLWTSSQKNFPSNTHLNYNPSYIYGR